MIERRDPVEWLLRRHAECVIFVQIVLQLGPRELSLLPQHIGHGAGGARQLLAIYFFFLLLEVIGRERGDGRRALVGRHPALVAAALRQTHMLDFLRSFEYIIARGRV